MTDFSLEGYKFVSVKYCYVIPLLNKDSTTTTTTTAATAAAAADAAAAAATTTTTKVLTFP